VLVDLSQPLFSSGLILGDSGNGKTTSLASIHKVLRQKGLPTRIAIFDFDDDGAEPILRFARDGREVYSDKPKTVPPWSDDILLFRYPVKRRKFRLDQTNPAPQRDKNLAIDFMTEFNQLDDRLEYRPTSTPQTVLAGQIPPTPQAVWKPGLEIGAILLDGLTGIADLFEDYVWVLRDRELGERPPTDRTAKDHSITWTEWNLLGEKIREVYMTAKGFPCYVLCTGHVDLREQEVRGPQSRHGTDSAPIVTGEYYTVPLLTKSLAMRIAKDFSFKVLATPDHKFQTRPDKHLKGVGIRGKDDVPELIPQDLSLIIG
jgi:hypothetical protein